MNINKIVIAGAGTMGSSMAQIYAKYFDNVTLYNHREESLKKAEVRIKENVDIRQVFQLTGLHNLLINQNVS